jgi:hypothetical protein
VTRSRKRPLPPAAALAGVLLLAVPIAAALLLRPGIGAGASPAATPAPAPAAGPSSNAGPAFPAPPPGAVVFARQLGRNALALGIVPWRGSALLQASVVNGDGVGVSGLGVSFRLQGAGARATACGRGCYRATLPVRGRPAAVEVSVRGASPADWRVALPSTWPPPDGAALLRRAERVWRALDSLSFSETLGSGTGTVVSSNWQLQAPDRLAYQVKGGWAAVIVGARRWDRAPGRVRWVESPQSPLTQPVPTWVTVRDAHVLGRVTVRGRPAWLVSFYDPVTPAWFTAAIDRTTLRTLDVHMVATAHFMHDAYGAFNATAPITPPR